MNPLWFVLWAYWAISEKEDETSEGAPMPLISCVVDKGVVKVSLAMILGSLLTVVAVLVFWKAWALFLIFLTPFILSGGLLLLNEWHKWYLERKYKQ